MKAQEIKGGKYTFPFRFNIRTYSGPHSISLIGAGLDDSYGPLQLCSSKIIIILNLLSNFRSPSFRQALWFLLLWSMSDI